MWLVVTSMGDPFCAAGFPGHSIALTFQAFCKGLSQGGIIFDEKDLIHLG